MMAQSQWVQDSTSHCFLVEYNRLLLLTRTCSDCYLQRKLHMIRSRCQKSSLKFSGFLRRKMRRYLTRTMASISSVKWLTSIIFHQRKVKQTGSDQFLTKRRTKSKGNTVRYQSRVTQASVQRATFNFLLWDSSQVHFGHPSWFKWLIDLLKFEPKTYR